MVGIASFLVHEFAHWLAGVVLGHEMVATLNSVSPVGAISVQDQMLILAAGPLVTIGQGIIGFLLVRRHASHFGFALLYMAFFMRLLAAGISFFNVNDEAKISQLAGLGTWAVPVAVVTGLLVLVILASRTLRLKFRDHLFCYLVSSAVITAIVGVDAVLWPKA